MKKIFLSALCLLALQANAQSVIAVVYDGNTATVDIPTDVTDVTYTIDGANVTINSATTSQEYQYTLSGSSSNGSFTLNGSYKLTLELAGLNLTCQSTKKPAIDIECGKRIAVQLKKGTTNTVVDAANGKQKAAIYFTGHPEFGKSGVLNVTGNTKHAISAKEYFQIKGSCVINVLGAVSDGIHCGKASIDGPASEHNYFLCDGGTINISNVGGDCIDADDYGCMTITDGTLNLNVTADDVKALSCDHTFSMTGGNVNINITGNDCDGISNYGGATFSGGDLNIFAIGNGSKGIKCKVRDGSDGKDPIMSSTAGCAIFNGASVEVVACGFNYNTSADFAVPACVSIENGGKMTMTDGDVTLRTAGPDAKDIRLEDPKCTKSLEGGTLLCCSEVDLDVPASGWTTMYLGIPVAIPDGVNVYYAKGIDGNTVQLKQIQGVVPASTPVLVKAAAGKAHFNYPVENVLSPSKMGAPSPIEDNLFEGVMFNTPVAEQEVNVLSPATTANSIVFKVFDGETIAWRTAYLPTEALSGADINNVQFVVESPTGINDISVNNTDKSGIRYNVAGQRVGNDYKGIVIIDGVKVIQ